MGVVEAEWQEGAEELARLHRLAENPYVGGMAKRRVRQWTAARKRKFCQLVAAGASITKAAEAVGCTRQSAHYQRQIDPNFAGAWGEALERQADLAEDALAELAHKTKNVGAVIFSLKNLRHAKWKDRHELDVERHNFNFNITASLPPEALPGILAALDRERALEALSSEPQALPRREAPEGGEEARGNGP